MKAGEKFDILPLIGAIRWDAWFPGNVYPGFVDRSLYTDYSYREPFNGWFNTGVPNQEEFMNREIEYAINSKLDFWAFVWYPENCEHPGISRMNSCLNYYMSCKNITWPGFALILQTGWVAGEYLKRWRPEFVPDFVNKMLDGRYVKVEGNRPLIFWMDTEYLSDKNRGFGAMWKEEIRYLIDRTAAEGLGQPFFVDMRHDFKSAGAYGFDGVSDYGPASIKMTGHHPYSDLVRHEQNKLECTHGLKIVPCVSAVIDPRPRDLGEWTKQTGIRYGFSFEFPTCSEWLNHLKYTYNWVKNNPDKTSNPGVIIIYAWNEIDEGGPGIVPTKQMGTMFLDAIRAIKTGEYPLTVLDTINDSNPAIKYSGNWEKKFPVSGCYCNDASCSNNVDDYFEFGFKGTSLFIIGEKGPESGIVDIWIDGVIVRSVDLYNTEAVRSQIIFQNITLEEGNHTLKGIVTGKRNPLSKGTYVFLDAIKCGKHLFQKDEGFNLY